jgi:hypothetical protein
LFIGVVVVVSREVVVEFAQLAQPETIAIHN